MLESDYIAKVAEFVTNYPPRFQETRKAAQETFKQLGLPEKTEIHIVSRQRVISKDSEVKLQTNGRSRDLYELGLGQELPVASVVGTKNPEGNNIYVSFDRFSAPFLREHQNDSEMVSVGAMILFPPVVEELYHISAKEIQLPDDAYLISRLIQESVKNAAEMVQKTPEIARLANYAEELERKLTTQKPFLVGKGGHIQLRLGDLAYLFSNFNQHVMALNILRQRAISEFVKQMQKQCKSWFIPPDKWSPEWQNFYAKQQRQYPSINELDINGNGIVVSSSMLGKSFLSGELAKLTFNRAIPPAETIETMAAKLKTAFSGGSDKQDPDKAKDSNNEIIITVKEFKVIPPVKANTTSVSYDDTEELEEQSRKPKPRKQREI